MAELFQVTDHDRFLFDTELAGFLPDSFIDIHTHVWLDAHKRHSGDEFSRVVSWPSLVAKDNSIQDLLETYRLLFPGKSVVPLMFSEAGPGDNLDSMNEYVSVCAREHGFPALLFARPDWSGVEVEKRITAGGFSGVKVYLSLSPSYIPRSEIRIFDFLPLHQLHELNKNERIVMLHIPRDGRLRDPVNIAQMLEIENNFPGVKLIIAHVGRAYCDEDIGDAFERLSCTKNMLFDTSANTNDTVFTRLLEKIGPERVLFGSDLPITRMRMRRLCEGGKYINVVPRGLYGDLSGDPNMREIDPSITDPLTTFLYEELRAIKRACSRVGVGKNGVEAIFYRNARRILKMG